MNWCSEICFCFWDFGKQNDVSINTAFKSAVLIHHLDLENQRFFPYALNGIRNVGNRFCFSKYSHKGDRLQIGVLWCAA